ncbi:MAG: serine/threonine-protein kinase [Acidimicrobiia bacterium]|nr:serine/threonine-protein kinase [Acidimicrobiia bacterium]
MALIPGTRLGVYEVTAQIGEGGMGAVFRARDTKLDRDVAIKVLPEAFAHDADRLARFTREAKTLAALNHPHIAQIHGLEESAGITALVMELVEGDDLSQRIAKGAIPLDEALPIATQIAEALEAAHEQGIIHRDLKPANIKVRPDGTVKVLDFGLAKAMEPAGAMPAGHSMMPTITSPAMTQAGMILGTAAYMAPEQARGKPVDKRADIWAFGAVLFEMLSGRRAFAGEDVGQTLARVVEREPDFAALPATVPAHVGQAIRVCLRKDPKQRAQAIGDVRLALEGAFETAAPRTTPSATASSRGRLLWMVATAAVAASAALAAVAGWWLKPSAAPRVERFAVTLPPGGEFGPGTRRLVAISPDGMRIVYAANNRLNLRTLDTLVAVPVPGTDGTGTNPAMQPFFSPDGQWVAYWHNGQLRKVAATGGAPIALATVTGIFSGSWGPDDSIVYSSGSDIWKIPGAGGTPEQIVKVAAGEVVQGPQMLPGGQHVLFTVSKGGSNWDAAQIVAHSLRDGTRTVLVDGGRDGRYVRTGHLIYASRGTLFGVPFDRNTMQRSGGPVSLEDGVADAGPASGAAHFAVSDEGTLTYVPGGSANALRALTWVDRQGREEPIAAPLRPYAYARLSPDGTRIGLDIRDDTSGIWTWDIARQTLTRLTFDAGLNRGVVWSPDGRRIAFSAQPEGRENVFWQAADGAGMVEQLTREDRGTFPVSFTPDGKRLVVIQPSGAPPRDLAVVSLDGDRKVQPLLNGEFDETNGEISPDGRWLAYESLESGRQEVYVRPFPAVESGRWQVSSDGGSRPVWGRNGRELFYWVDDGTVMAADLQAGPTFVAGTPRRVISGRYVAPLNGRPFDVTRDGRRFLMIKTPDTTSDTAERPRVVVVQGWFEELKRRVPVP